MDSAPLLTILLAFLIIFQGYKTKTDNIKGKNYLFFDEIHKIDNWQKSINGYRVDLDADIYVTGSYGQMLNGINSTDLSGRYVTIKMYPFSYNELLNYYKYDQNTIIDPMTEVKIFNDFLSYGRFPRLLHYNDHDEKIDYLYDIYDSIMLKDIMDIENIGSIDLFRRLMEFMICNIGNIFSANSISKYLKSEKKINNNKNKKASPNTILDYINYASNTFFIIPGKGRNKR